MRKANISATVFDHQIPPTPKSFGSRRTEPSWNTSVRRKETAAETAPLLSAVKKEDIKMLNPTSRKQKEKMRNACEVMSKRVWS